MLYGIYGQIRCLIHIQISGTAGTGEWLGDTRSPIFTAALFTASKIRRQFKYPLRD